MWKDFKPAFRFVLVFVSCYVVANGLYGLYLARTNPQPDFFTRLISNQTVAVLNLFNEPAHTVNRLKKPLVAISTPSRVVLDVYEGCNGINVVIVFLTFIVAYQGFNQSKKKMIWFVPMGIVTIWMANIMRIFLLYFVASYYKIYFYFVHKYVFTLFLYAIVLFLWWWWIRLTEKPVKAPHAS